MKNSPIISFDSAPSKYKSLSIVSVILSIFLLSSCQEDDKPVTNNFSYIDAFGGGAANTTYTDSTGAEVTFRVGGWGIQKLASKHLQFNVTAKTQGFLTTALKYLSSAVKDGNYQVQHWHSHGGDGTNFFSEVDGLEPGSVFTTLATENTGTGGFTVDITMLPQSKCSHTFVFVQACGSFLTPGRPAIRKSLSGPSPTFLPTYMGFGNNADHSYSINAAAIFYWECAGKTIKDAKAIANNMARHTVNGTTNLPPLEIDGDGDFMLDQSDAVATAYYEHTGVKVTPDPLLNPVPVEGSP